MFKVIGFVAFVAAGALGVAQFTGVANVTGDVEVTEHGRQVASDQLKNAKEGISTGLDALREKIHEGTAVANQKK